MKWKLTPKLKRKLDRLFSQFILSRDNRTCQRCGKSNVKIDTAHILPKEFTLTRWLPDNAIALCVSCHKFNKTSFHKSPIHFTDWFIGKYGQDKVNALMALSLCKSEWKKEDVDRLIINLK